MKCTNFDEKYRQKRFNDRIAKATLFLLVTVVIVGAIEMCSAYRFDSERVADFGKQYQLHVSTHKPQTKAMSKTFNVRYWQLKNDNSGYKNERLRDLQEYAFNNGVEEWKLRTLAAWFIQENGALSENVRGDSGWSIGLCQCHTGYRKCAAEGDYHGQRKQCIDWFKGYTENSTKDTILTDIRRGHNSRAYPWYENGMKNKRFLFE